MDNKFVYADGGPATHKWYDGTPHPWEFARVWHLEPSLADPGRGLRRRARTRGCSAPTDGGQSWNELPGLRAHRSAPDWQPGAGGLCLHTILLDPATPARMFIAISAAGVFRSDDAGVTWRPINRGLSPRAFPIPMPKSATASIASRCIARARTCCSCRSTGTSCAPTTPANRGAR